MAVVRRAECQHSGETEGTHVGEPMPGPFTIVGGGLVGTAVLQWWILRRKGVQSKRWLVLWSVGLPVGMVAFALTHLLVDVVFAVSWAAEVGLIGFAIGACAAALSGHALFQALSGEAEVAA